MTKREIQKLVTESLRECEMTRKDLSPEVIKRLKEKSNLGLAPFVVTMSSKLEPYAYVFPFDRPENEVFDTNILWRDPNIYSKYPNFPPNYGVRVWAENRDQAEDLGRNLVRKFLESRGTTSK
jgi:hypothetical protein